MFGFKKKYYLQEKVIKSLESDVKMLATSVDSVTQLLANERPSSSTYATRASQVGEMIKKYHGLSTKGNVILQRCVNLRVAFSIPNRLFLIKNPLANVSDSVVKKAKEFLNEFLQVNNLDSYLPRDLAKEGEIQGSVACSLKWNETLKMPEIIYYPWNSTGYKIKEEKESEKYTINKRLKLSFTDTATSGTGEVKIDSDNLIYIAFNDDLGVMDGYPTCGPILQIIDKMDSDITDWRALNHLFAHPTPHFKCETREEAIEIQNQIVNTGWKVGTAIATRGDLKLVGPSGVEAQMLMNSIQTLAKIISGHTGIGIHFLGFANVMSNRATADSMGEPTEVVLHSEISSWIKFYTDMFVKAIEMRNKKLHQGIDPTAVKPWLVPLTDRQWKVVENVYLPALEGGNLSRETFLANIPGIDADEEMEKIEEQEKQDEEKMRKKKEIFGNKDDEEENDEENSNKEGKTKDSDRKKV